MHNENLVWLLYFAQTHFLFLNQRPIICTHTYVLLDVEATLHTLPLLGTVRNILIHPELPMSLKQLL